MYLSKVQLDWKDTRNPYDWHRALWRLFPDQPQETRAFLFRVEQQRLGQGALILLQSPTAPNPYDAAVRVVAEPKRLDLAELPEGISLRFRLIANVIKTIRDAQDPERPVRVPLVKEEQQMEWLERKFADAAGIETATVTPNPPLFFKRNGQAGKLVTTTFDGRLRVLDLGAFQHLLENGIGAAKSFGCGLLSVARISVARTA
jgi:CRISPR system Cascade subunit CasE